MAWTRIAATLAATAVLCGCSDTGPGLRPIVRDVTPPFGPASGRTYVTIAGTNFVDITSVTIGGRPFDSLGVMDSTHITGLTPAAATTTSTTVADVVVTSGSQGAGTCAGCFTYNPNITVSALSPEHGFPVGGTGITITGTNFVHVVRITVGDHPLRNYLVVSATQITGTVETANSRLGSKDVVVTSNSHGTAICRDCYTYVRPTPAPVSFASVVAGGLGSCGVSTSHTAFCWGGSSVGDGSTDTSSVPVAVEGGLTFSALAAGNFGNCGVTQSSFLHCWGELVGSFPLPALVGGSQHFSSVVIGDGVGPGHACALTTAGAAYCWGNNTYGQVGEGTASGDQIFNGWQVRSTPVPVAGGHTYAALAAGLYHTCGLDTGGVAYCWGDDGSGSLGDGAPVAFSSVPVRVAGGLTFTSIAAGGGAACGLTSNGSAYCWGSNGTGVLGNGTAASSTTPVEVTGGLTFTAISVGSGHACGLTSSGAAYCWGAATNGQLGTGAEGPDQCAQFGSCSFAPVAVAGGLTFASMSAGGQNTCGVTSAGVAYCWGDNRYGQVGDGTITSRSTPTRVVGQQ